MSPFGEWCLREFVGDESFNTAATSFRCRERDCVDEDGRRRFRCGNKCKRCRRHCFFCLLSLVVGLYNALWVPFFVTLVVVELPNPLDSVSYKERSGKGGVDDNLIGRANLFGS